MTSPRRFPLFRSNAWQLEPPNELIAGVVSEASLAVLVAPPKSFKTFTALHISACISLGTPWFGRDTSAGPVVYVSGEGQGGLKARVEALELHLGTELPDLWILPEAVNLLNKQDTAAFLAQLGESGIRPRLVVIDTLQRSTVGAEENSTKDMGLAVSSADEIRLQTGAAVLLLHHPTKKDSSVLRGAGSLSGALDTLISIKRPQPNGNTFTLNCELQKDREAAFLGSFQMTPSGDSLVPEMLRGGISAVAKAPGKQDEHARTILGLLTDPLPYGEWLRRAMNVGVSRTGFNRARLDLKKAGVIGQDEQRRWFQFQEVSNGFHEADETSPAPGGFIVPLPYRGGTETEPRNHAVESVA